MKKVKKAGLMVMGLAAGLLGSNALLASDSGHDKQHFVGVFAGVLDNDGTETVLGLEYEYKFNSQWGVGALYESAGDAHHGAGVTSKIAALYYHPSGGWRLGLGLGKETVGSFTDSTDHFHSSHSEDLTRIGVSYEFHAGGIGIEPSFNIDRVDGENIKVYGVALVWAF